MATDYGHENIDPRESYLSKIIYPDIMQNFPRLKENHRNLQIVKPTGAIWFEPNTFHLTDSRTEALTQWKENKQRQLVGLLCLFEVSNYITNTIVF